MTTLESEGTGARCGAVIGDGSISSVGEINHADVIAIWISSSASADPLEESSAKRHSASSYSQGIDILRKRKIQEELCDEAFRIELIG